MSGVERTRKPRAKPGNPYDRSKTSQRNPKPAHATSALPPKQTTRAHLTTGDWLTVYAYIDSHPDMNQNDIVKHFSTRREGALMFTQTTLSRKLRDRPVIEKRADENPNALSAKKARVTTRPDVERYVLEWYQNMQARNEIVTGAMLMEKRRRIEERMDIPKEECLSGEGWVRSFCKAYKVKEIRRHGEAGSVDLAAVHQERLRLHNVLKPYAPRDRWNLDESGLVCFAIPDRGLSSGPMSGKKQNKFRITVTFAVNSDGSERMPVFYIGKSKNPRAFKKKDPKKLGFYYRNNKKAWMTSELYEEWIRQSDRKMRLQQRNVILTQDNFSGHGIAYEPTNVAMEFFEPNMTSFVQPLDAGIIRCFKANYRNAMCIRALDLDEAGDEDIFKLDLLEAMTMARDAWAKVSAETIANCWKHTGILPPVDLTDVPSPPSEAETTLAAAWNIVREFAATDKYTLPAVERALQAKLGNRYIDADWQPALTAVMNAETDTARAVKEVERLAIMSLAPPAATGELINAETNLSGNLRELKERKRMHGALPSMCDVLDPIDELVEDEPEAMPTEEEIIAKVQHDMAIERGEIIEIDDDDDDEGPDEVADLTTPEGIALIQQLEQFLTSQGDSFGLVPQLRKVRGGLFKEVQASLVQKPLEAFFKAQNSRKE